MSKRWVQWGQHWKIWKFYSFYCHRKGIFPAAGTAIVVLLCSRMPTAVTGRCFRGSWACTDLWITMPDGIWKQKVRGLSFWLCSFLSIGKKKKKEKKNWCWMLRYNNQDNCCKGHVSLLCWTSSTSHEPYLILAWCLARPCQAYPISKLSSEQNLTHWRINIILKAPKEEHFWEGGGKQLCVSISHQLI